MNPSTGGWIKKLMQELEGRNTFLNESQIDFYNALKQSGFIYGSNTHIVEQLVNEDDLTDMEMSKVNLFLALHFTHHQANTSTDLFESLIGFYKEIKVHRPSFFNRLLVGNSVSSQLEKLIHKRVQIDDNLLTKNFNYFVINALLFVDVLGYQEYLTNNCVSESYIKNLEASIETIVYFVLNAKDHRNEYDESLLKLFEVSLRYQDNTNISYEEAVKSVHSNQEKWYLLDLACMATWSDRIIDENEQIFLHNLGEDFKLDKEWVTHSISSVNSFYNTNKDNIALLSSRNIVKNFYDNSSKMVSKLISRNRKRLYKELVQSKELVKLISQSTVRDLSSEEHKKLQEQLLDIIKTVPSLAIFMLPGGALLLPLFVKFIPKLLPSAFDDNRIKNDKQK